MRPSKPRNDAPPQVLPEISPRNCHAHREIHPCYTFPADPLAQLQQVVPEAFADGKINWNTLKKAQGGFLVSGP